MISLDNGPEAITFWPTVEVTNTRGNIVRRIVDDSEAVTLQCWAAPAGPDTYTITASSLPSEPWGKALWNDREWDIEPPGVEQWETSLQTVAQATIKARAPLPASG